MSTLHDYSSFIKATKEDDQGTMKMFIDRHPEALTAPLFHGKRTALHHALSDPTKTNMARWLVDRMTASDLEIQDEYGHTPLARGVYMDYPSLLFLLQLMVNKNPRLPNIQNHVKSGLIPVEIALEKGYNNTAAFLYRVTDANILSSDAGGRVLSLCIKAKTFDIALDLVERFPHVLLQDTFDWRTLPEAFSEFPSESQHQKSHKFILGYKLLQISEKCNDDEKRIQDQAHAFFKSVSAKVSTYKVPESLMIAHKGIICATRQGNIEFINEMIKANPALLYARTRGRSLFWHAVENRQEKIFSLIYGATAERQDGLVSYLNAIYGATVETKEVLLSTGSNYNDEYTNILHLAAKLPPPTVLDRISSSPALLMQRELLWFKEVWNVVNPRQRDVLNRDGLTPRQLFCQSHEKLIEAGEKSMKETATSSTVVGALILTIMFAAAFTVPGGNNQETGYPIFTNMKLFKLFITCDVLSLSSSATSILVFLSILANSHGDEDFLLDLPRRLVIGVLTLFFSIATMMMTFCFALALMLHGDLTFILPIALISSVPVLVFSSSMFHLLSDIFYSTFGSRFFDRNTKVPTPYIKELGENTMSCGMV